MVFASTAFVKSPNSGAALVLIVFALDTIFVGLPSVNLGLNVYASDIVFALLFSAGILRYVEGYTKVTRTRLAVIVMVTLYILAFARGASAFGIKQAGQGSRLLFYFDAGTFYFSSFMFLRRQQERMVRLWFYTTWVLIGVSVFRWVATIIGLGIASTWERMETSPMRVLNSAQAMFLCIAFYFSCITISGHKAKLQEKVLVYLLPPILILLQHRTVWIVLIVGLMWIFSKQTRALRRSLATALVVLAIAVPLIFFAFDPSYMIAMLVNSATDPSTFLWRVEGWSQLLGDANLTMVDYIIGQPAGYDQSRIIGKTLVEADPHNFYVQTFLSQGIVGLIVLLWLYCSQTTRFWKLRKKKSRFPRYLPKYMLGVFLISQMVFFVAYPPNYDQSLILGMAVGMGASRLGARKRVNVGTAAELTSPGEALA